ncbi:MAG: S41 family peptidase [Chloroflexi bacterium]|nr:MAG: S41 family peptidase [Chloroflexota bacterium]
MKQLKRNIILGVMAVNIFLAGMLFGTQLSMSQAQEQAQITLPPEAQAAFEPLFQAYNMIDSQYVSDVEIDVLVDGAIRGMVEALDDPYSNYVDPEFFPFVNNDLSGEIEGIGVVITETEDGNEIEIVNVLEGTPAEAAGLQPGDVFVIVNGENVYGLTYLELAARVRGRAGTTVNITMRRGQELIDFVVERARIEIPNVEYEILEGDIGYISMAQFSSLSRQQVDEALAAIHIDTLNGLIFDLRGNPGGYLSAAVQIGGLFLEEGTLLIEDFGDGTTEEFIIRDQQVFQVDQNGNETLYMSDVTPLNVDIPIVVLVDEFSASASELVAGAWQDNGVVTLIGNTTFGKGTVQTQSQLINGGGIRLTIARWLTPNGNWISEQGITPDILVTLPDNYDIEQYGDIQLKAALEYLMQETVEME